MESRSSARERHEAQAAMSRMARAGAEPVTTLAPACELQADPLGLRRCSCR